MGNGKSLPGEELRRWRSAADDCMRRRFGIDTADVGYSETELLRLFRSGLSAVELTDRIGQKYDLDEVIPRAGW